jgi:hypothetical protein
MRKCTCFVEMKCIGKTYQKIGGKTLTINVYECPHCQRLEYVRGEQ